MIIDFHVHTFPEKIAASTVRYLAGKSHTYPYTDGTIPGLISSMERSGVDLSVALPVATSPSQVEKVNRSILRDRMGSDYLQASCADTSHKAEIPGIISLACMHPEYEDYRRELRFLKDHGFPGIKLHPAYQNIDLDDQRMMRIIDAASDLDMIVLVHAGIDIGISEHNYSPVSQILTVIDQIHPPKLVLAHMGGWACWDEVESDLAGADVWLDTAFSIGDIKRLPGDPVVPYLLSNLTDEAFVRLCKKHGTSRILFATDCPWADQEDYVRRIRSLPFTDKEKSCILGENAARLLGAS